jgi:ubiquinone/menaquinone biosynthesis C-methylase UbiE
MENNHVEKWTKHYEVSKCNSVYPTEWVIRTIAGANYPEYKYDKQNYIGKKILDVSCGDGRNLELLLNLGFDVYATETSENTVNQLRERYPDVKFFIGFNHQHPFEDNYFDYVLACGAFYYLEKGTSLIDNLKELNRIMKSNGLFYANMPTKNHYILRNAECLIDSEMIITSDPHNCRNGDRWCVLNTKEEIIKEFEPYLQIEAFGMMDEDYFGYNLSNHILVAKSIK